MKSSQSILEYIPILEDEVVQLVVPFVCNDDISLVHTANDNIYGIIYDIYIIHIIKFYSSKFTDYIHLEAPDYDLGRFFRRKGSTCFIRGNEEEYITAYRNVVS